MQSCALILSPNSLLQNLNLIQLPEKTVWIYSKWVFCIRRDELIYTWLSATLCHFFFLLILLWCFKVLITIKGRLLQIRHLSSWTDFQEPNCLYYLKSWIECKWFLPPFPVNDEITLVFWFCLGMTVSLKHVLLRLLANTPSFQIPTHLSLKHWSIQHWLSTTNLTLR